MVICCREDASQTAARECLEETLGVIGSYDELHLLAIKDDVFKVLHISYLYSYVLGHILAVQCWE